jgi:hypothetical protein
VIPGILGAATAMLGGILAMYSKSQEKIFGIKSKPRQLMAWREICIIFSVGEISGVDQAEIIRRYHVIDHVTYGHNPMNFQRGRTDI